MIQFESVTYQNFLATGNVPITIPLNAHATTLIVGKNGAGKSTLSEAICFALFGKALRSVNKPALVNSINERDCLVELTFTTTSGRYLVRRGMKPTVFEIYHNDALVPPPANADDYQTMLESIIKLDQKSFKQVVVLASAAHVPFMRLTAAQRRDLIEDLLDIEVFSSMNALAKEDLTETKHALDKTAALRKSKGDQIRMAETYTAALQVSRQHELLEVESLIALRQQDIQELDDQLSATEQDLRALRALNSSMALADINQKRRAYERTLDQLKTKQRDWTRKEQFYTTNATCPECAQSIAESLKAASVATAQQKSAEAALAIAKCEHIIDQYRTKAEALITNVDQETRLSEDIAERTAERKLVTASLAASEARRAQLLLPVVVPDVDIPALQTEYAALNEQYDTLSRQRVIYDAAAQLLKDNGIKTKVVKHYLPIINKLVNHYLNAMDFPILFAFDDAFNESMKSRHRDEFTYESFSEGEKRRIDLALLLTWRAVAKLKNSASTNLLILDEVFDSSLDATGFEEVLKIIAGLEHDTNVFVISHRTDQLVDKFEHNIVFEKYKQFSRIA